MYAAGDPWLVAVPPLRVPAVWEKAPQPVLNPGRIGVSQTAAAMKPPAGRNERLEISMDGVVTTWNSWCAFAHRVGNFAFTSKTDQSPPGPASGQKRAAGPIGSYAVAFAAPFKKASRSALIVSASVVGMPCGKPW